MTALLHLLRGPLLMAAVVAALILPYLLQLSFETLVCLVIFAAGLFITLSDVIALAETSVRRKTSNFLDNIVLDNVLKSWFDPETGWVTCWVSFFVGNATMYTLPMTDDQRIRLVQSCLWTSDEQARSILTSPGGFKVMLPEKLQLWLYGDTVNEIEEPSDDNKNSDEQSDHECDRSNLTEETEPSETDTKGTDGDLNSHAQVPSNLEVKSNAPSVTRGLEVKKDAAATAPPCIVHQPQAHHPHQYPLDVMGSILKDIASDFIKRSCTRIPDSTVQGLAVAASAAFALQMYKSPRSRRIVTGAIEGSAALTFASVAVGAITALVTKAHVLDSPSSALVQQSSFLRGIHAKLRQAGGYRRVQGIIAVFVLWYFTRRRARQLQPSMHLSR